MVVVDDIHSKRVLPVAVESKTICWYGRDELLLLEVDVVIGALSRRWQEHCILKVEKVPVFMHFILLFDRNLESFWMISIILYNFFFLHM